MNDVLRALAAVAACGIVLVLAVCGVKAILGQWSLLVWIAIGFSTLMAVMRRVNA